MYVEVNMDHIRRGIRGDCEKCALSLAVKDHLAEGINVLVDGIEIAIFKSPLSIIRAEIPTTLRTFVSFFDSGIKCHGASGHIDFSNVPKEWLNEGNV